MYALQTAFLTSVTLIWGTKLVQNATGGGQIRENESRTDQLIAGQVTDRGTDRIFYFFFGWVSYSLCSIMSSSFLYQ